MPSSVFPKWEVIAVGLLLREGKVLLGLRNTEGNLWEFPGGRVEKREQPQTALVRELKEELGIQVQESEIADCLCDHKEGISRLIVFFYIQIWEGEIQKNCHLKLEWLSLRECKARKIPNINPSLFEKILKIIDQKIGFPDPH